MTLTTKRIYDEASEEDGTRVLVDRLWPRGIKKEDARIDYWLKELAPSHDLRKRYHGSGEDFEDFVEAYRAELDEPSEEAEEALETLKDLARDGDVTLLYAAKDREKNNAEALKRILAERL
ncbi:DUF488 family protein [Marinicauda algicola]|uniref:DUF488 family protein n=1 Tax=Marinicauda algicola TaxID=2029849 RepID=A0A4S2H3M1_9PROT|nr:DUF488 family protein [Marinicauda algicola]TGY90217.1 DUF488 family protein [Marinicauda algicola]